MPMMRHAKKGLLAVVLLGLLATPAQAFTKTFFAAVARGTTSASFSRDYTTGSLNGGDTFSRASTGNYFNSSGVLTSAANDAPRFDYNHSTLALSGLLIEPQSTNKVYPSLLNDTWTLTGITRTANAINGLNGVTEATLITENTASTAHNIARASIINVTNTVTYTFSAHVKYSNMQWVQLALSNAGFSGAYANFDLVNGVTGHVGSTGTTPSSSILSLGGGWYKISITAICVGGGNNGKANIGCI